MVFIGLLFPFAPGRELQEMMQTAPKTGMK
jgi:hypothetical protein